MNNATLTATLPARIEVIYHVLTSPTLLPDWNPAFVHIDGAPVAVVGTPYRLEIIRGLRGTFTYTRIDHDAVTMRWHVPGLSEECSWHLAEKPQGRSTGVTHTVKRSGVLSTLLSGALETLPALRLERLAQQVLRPLPPQPFQDFNQQTKNRD